MTSTIAVILARGGSKRIPKKNIVPINGLPMLAWTVKAALQSGAFARVLVSTDSEDIALIARSFGAEVPFLRETCADDHSSSSEATIVALKQAEEYWGEQYDIVCQLMANCPMRSGDDISSAFNFFLNSKAPAQVSCFKFGWMNPWWSFRLDEANRPSCLFPDAIKSRSQDLPILYCPSGAIWIAYKKTLEEHRSFYAPGHIFCELSWMAAMDIDDYDDLIMAEALMSIKEKSITLD